MKYQKPIIEHRVPLVAYLTGLDTACSNLGPSLNNPHCFTPGGGSA